MRDNFTFILFLSVLWPVGWVSDRGIWFAREWIIVETLSPHVTSTVKSRLDQKCPLRNRVSYPCVYTKPPTGPSGESHPGHRYVQRPRFSEYFRIPHFIILEIDKSVIKAKQYWCLHKLTFEYWFCSAQLPVERAKRAETLRVWMIPVRRHWDVTLTNALLPHRFVIMVHVLQIAVVGTLVSSSPMVEWYWNLLKLHGEIWCHI